MDNIIDTGESHLPTIEQYFMAHAKPPKVIFERVIYKSRVRIASGDYINPQYADHGFDAVVTQLAEADADYRIAFAKAMTAKIKAKE